MVAGRGGGGHDGRHVGHGARAHEVVQMVPSRPGRPHRAHRRRPEHQRADPPRPARRRHDRGRDRHGRHAEPHQRLAARRPALLLDGAARAQQTVGPGHRAQRDEQPPGRSRSVHVHPSPRSFGAASAGGRRPEQSVTAAGHRSGHRGRSSPSVRACPGGRTRKRAQRGRWGSARGTPRSRSRRTRTICFTSKTHVKLSACPVPPLVPTPSPHGSAGSRSSPSCAWSVRPTSGSSPH